MEKSSWALSIQWDRVLINLLNFDIHFWLVAANWTWLSCLCFVSFAVHKRWNNGLSNCFCKAQSMLSVMWSTRSCPSRCNASSMCQSRLAHSFLHAVSCSVQAEHAQGCCWYAKWSDYTRKKEATRRESIMRINPVIRNNSIHGYPLLLRLPKFV